MTRCNYCKPKSCFLKTWEKCRLCRFSRVRWSTPYAFFWTQKTFQNLTGLSSFFQNPTICSLFYFTVSRVLENQIQNQPLCKACDLNLNVVKTPIQIMLSEKATIPQKCRSYGDETTWNVIFWKQTFSKTDNVETFPFKIWRAVKNILENHVFENGPITQNMSFKRSKKV